MVDSISKEESIGYHKGAINTLLAERNELLKIVSVTENLIQAHAQELQKLGVNISQTPAPSDNQHTDSKSKKKA